MNTGTTNSQVENLSILLPNTPPKADAPRMPFRTAYKLTLDQETALVDHAIKRLDQIEQQLGKRQPTQSPQNVAARDFSITSDPYSFFGKREKYTARYYNHVADRVEPNTIYEHSNLTASLSQRITAQMVAKSCSFFFGQPDDDEWFTAEGVGLDDDELADKIKKYARYVARHCKVKERHCQGVEFSWVRGESVIKTTHQEQFQIYKRTATFLVDGSGEPILDAHGDYILQSDTWVAEMIPAPAPPAPTPQIQPQAQQPSLPVPAQAPQGDESQEGQPNADGSGQSPAPAAPAAPAAAPQSPDNDQDAPNEPDADQDDAQTPMVATGNKILKRDGVTLLPENPIWKTDVITRRLVTWSGPDSRICYYKDFLCPIDAPGIQPGEADLIAHLYDKSVMEIAQMFASQLGEGDEGVADIQAAVELLRNMIANSAMRKSAEGQPRIDFYEQATDGSPNNPTCQIAECWLTYDADGDGIQEEIMLVVDRRNKAPIFYEYTANVTLRGLRPFEVIRPMSVDGRWYGMGAMEYFDPEQEFIDLQINRRNFRDGAAGRTTFWSPWATLEGQRDPNLRLNNGKTYTLREGYKAEQALSYVTLPDDTRELKEMIDLFMQLMQIKSGVVNGADQQISGLPAANTATGINEVSESGQELFAMFLLRLFPGIQAALVSVVDTIFSQMDSRQIFTYFNGDAHEILELTPDDIRDLALHVTLSITQQRDRQILQAGNIADQVIDGYYKRPLILQERTTAYAQARLKSLRVPQPDTIIDRLTLPLVLPREHQGKEGMRKQEAPMDQCPMNSDADSPE